VDFIGPLPHSHIAAEYAAASVFVYASLNETFGLPPLEAMAVGVPVVASRAASIPEVVGEAAELVDPLEIADIVRGLRRVLLDPDRARTLISLGTQRVRAFSWDECARRTVGAMRAALS
jgi:glycosyltransferase involved in cell wall biosynthesis